MNEQERSVIIDDMIKNPEKYKRECLARAREEHPEMTEEQLENQWQFVVEQFGL